MTDWTTNGRHRTRHFGSRDVWIRIAIAVIAVVPVVPAPTLSQTCEDDNPPHAAALIGRLQSYCEDNFASYPYTFDLYALASVAGTDAIPALRKIAAWPLDTTLGSRCQQWVAASRVALAKLGDDDSRSLLDAQLRKPESANDNALASLSFIGDDRALLALIHFLVDHAEDPAMIGDFGDYSVDRRDGLLQEIDSIRRRRRVPGLPTADYSPAGIAQWKEYLATHEGQQVTFPVYPNVSDPYLKCLARRVEWGYPDAILAIAASGNNSAASILRQFPSPTQNALMGFAQSSPFSNRHWSLIEGNVQVALAQLGDQEMFDHIVSGLGGAFAHESVRKLEFLGGKPAVAALVKALSVPDEVVEKARAKACGQSTDCYGRGQIPWKPIWTVTPMAVEIDREACLQSAITLV